MKRQAQSGKKQPQKCRKKRWKKDPDNYSFDDTSYFHHSNFNLYFILQDNAENVKCFVSFDETKKITYDKMTGMFPIKNTGTGVSYTEAWERIKRDRSGVRNMHRPD